MNLTSKSGYARRYWHYKKEGYTSGKAWEKTQNDFERIHGELEHKGFSTLDSFCNALRRWIKAKDV